MVTKAAELTIDNKDYRILRLYNPWGNEVEWKGEWSDNSLIWRKVDQSIKKELELTVEYDGEFW